MSQLRILFVCMGNICRSPAAEGVLKHKVIAEGLETYVEIDSAGTLSYHAGSRADNRMRTAAHKRGISLESIARKILPEDLEIFDLIITMDDDNFRDVQALDRKGLYAQKIKRFTDYCTEHTDKEVPDPYYGGDKGFEHVLNLLEDGCTTLMNDIRKLR